MWASFDRLKPENLIIQEDLRSRKWRYSTFSFPLINYINRILPTSFSKLIAIAEVVASINRSLSYFLTSSSDFLDVVFPI